MRREIPMQPKNSLEFLRKTSFTCAYQFWLLRRSVLSFAVHVISRKVCVNIITGSDEGAGEMFKVTALPFDNTHTEEESKL
jgi:asparaginyl-tRNA synthetase